MNAVMIEVGVPVVTVGRRCGIEEVFANPFIELLALAPKNPIVRGLILAQTGRMPAPDCGTFEQIREWVETTCDKKMRPFNGTRAATDDGITIKVDFSETENGRAYYSVTRSGSTDFTLDAEELLTMVQATIAAGAGLEHLIKKVADQIEEDAWERCEPDLDDYGDYDYGDHDSNSTEDSEVEFSRVQLRDRLRIFLRERHPELLEALT